MTIIGERYGIPECIENTELLAGTDGYVNERTRYRAP